MKQLFSYDQICLRPKYSELESRDKADTSVDFLGYKFKVPVVPSNMIDVMSWELASALDLNSYFYIMHRFNDANQNIPSHIREFSKIRSISIGVNSSDRYDLERVEFTPQFITIDVAHAHHKKVEEMTKFVRDSYSDIRKEKKPKLIIGNVATSDGYRFCCDLGADAVKVGIGGGSICTTRNKTGFHLPTATSVHECASVGKDVPIIADGGARDFGDVAKALVLGATMVMSGSWFASCIDSPAKIENGRKLYRGSTSYEAKGHRKHIEGRTLELEEGLTFGERLEEIRQAIASSISYAGGKDLSAFNSVTWYVL